MKRLGKITFLLYLLTISTIADSSWWLGVGNGGKFEKPSLSLGMRGNEWGADIDIIFNSDYSEDEVLDYSVPHNSFVIVDSEAYIGNTLGFDIFRYFNIKDNQSVFLGLGAYFSKACEVAQSNATGWLYCENSKDDTTVSGSIGYMFSFDQISLGIGYHSARGTELTIGTSW